jgi:hypothetical protein
MIQEAIQIMLTDAFDNTAFESIRINPSFHQKLNLFPREISPIQLSAITKETLQKFKRDYMMASFHNLFEWQHLKQDTVNASIQKIEDNIGKKLNA